MARTRPSSIAKVKAALRPSRSSERVQRAKSADIAGDELSAMVLRACGIARDSVFNVRDFLSDNSRMAFLAIKDCEKELDQIERKIDEHLPDAITGAGIGAYWGSRKESGRGIVQPGGRAVAAAQRPEAVVDVKLRG